MDADERGSGISLVGPLLGLEQFLIGKCFLSRAFAEPFSRIPAHEAGASLQLLGVAQPSVRCLSQGASIPQQHALGVAFDLDMLFEPLDLAS